MTLSSYKYALIAPRLEKILAQNASPKLQEWQSYGKFRKVTLNPHFSEKVESAKTGGNCGAKKSYKSSRIAKLWQFWHGHPKPAISKKRAKRGPREIFQK